MFSKKGAVGQFALHLLGGRTLPCRTDLSASWQDFIEAFAEQLSVAGYQLLVQAFPTQEQVLAHLSEIAQGRVCDAVILWGSHAQVAKQGSLLDDLKMPFVVKGRFEDTHPGWLQVDVGHEDMMARAVAHLVDRGLPLGCRIGYLEYATEEPFARLLRNGLADALRHRGYALEPTFTVSGEVGTDDFEKAVERWLDLPAPAAPGALVVGAGSTAWRTIELALARRGRRIGHGPGEMPVVGTAGPDFVLLDGDAHTFRGMHTLDMARALVDRLLLPLLQSGGSGSDKTESTLPNSVRLRPALEPVPTLRLLEHGFCLSAPTPHTSET